MITSSPRALAVAGDLAAEPAGSSDNYGVSHPRIMARP
jgi:hypothetical protein